MLTTIITVSSSAATAILAVNGNDVRMLVTGVNPDTYDWSCRMTVEDQSN